MFVLGVVNEAGTSERNNQRNSLSINWQTGKHQYTRPSKNSWKKGGSRTVSRKVQFHMICDSKLKCGTATNV